ncbi:MAG: hypothetical protein FWC98_03460 [Bacteroidales bacterium]|nr:hypothetical protein [Bacteroidales bacterium]
MADFLIDVAKYVLTVAIVMSFLGEFGEKRFLYYGIGAFFVVVCFVFGLFIINTIDKKEENNNKK